MPDPLLELIRANVQRGQFNLSAGGGSDWFVDMQVVMLGQYSPLQKIGQEIRHRCWREGARENAYGGPGVGGALLVGALLSITTPAVGFVVRPEPDRNGHTITGPLAAGMRAVVVDDVCTSGKSLLQSCIEVERVGAKVQLVIAVVDRLEGGRELLEGAGYRFISLYDRDDILGE